MDKDLAPQACTYVPDACPGDKAKKHFVTRVETTPPLCGYGLNSDCTGHKMPQFKDDRFDPSKAACPKLWCHMYVVIYLKAFCRVYSA
jgi:hypothetical protein